MDEARPRELLLLRHGKSDWDVPVPDLERPLKDRGKHAAQRAGAWLAGQGLVPDHVRSSPAERARVTAEKACKTMGIALAAIAMDERIYDAPLARLLEVLAGCPQQASRVLIVGHNPGFEDLLSHLAPAPPAGEGKLFPTAALARLAMPADWRALDAGCARLLAFVRPRELPRDFPWPAPGGPERRPRPAYYYRQVAAVPWRERGGKLEVLVITSGTQRRWVVPKGVSEPGLAPAQAAAREALEEGGVEGTPGPMLGRYQYDKWGAPCDVEVYALQVERELSEDEWPEAHRRREWLTLDSAAERVQDDGLRPLVRGLPGAIGGRSQEEKEPRPA